MNLDWIEAFYWAGTLNGISRAAKKLRLAQSTISHRLRQLEKNLKVQLIDRRDAHFKLTPAGARFLVDAGRLVTHWGEIETRLGSGKQRTVSLHLGVIESVLHSWLIPWIERLRAEQPGIELALTVEPTLSLLELMKAGKVDLVVAAQPVSGAGVRTRELRPMPMAFVGKRTVHTQRQYTLQKLAEGELLTFQHGSQPHAALSELLSAAGLTDARVHAISSISAMERLVAAGFGVATLPQAAVEHSAEEKGLRLLACDVELASLPIHASWRTDPLSKTIDAIVESAVMFAAATGAHRISR